MRSRLERLSRDHPSPPHPHTHSLIHTPPNPRNRDGFPKVLLDTWIRNGGLPCHPLCCSGAKTQQLPLVAPSRQILSLWLGKLTLTARCIPTRTTQTKRVREGNIVSSPWNLISKGKQHPPPHHHHHPTSFPATELPSYRTQLLRSIPPQGQSPLRGLWRLFPGQLLSDICYL